jgi:pilus assembly protein CpaC
LTCVGRRSVLRRRPIALLLAALAAIWVLLPVAAQSAETATAYTVHSDGRQASHVVVTLNKSRVIQFNRAIAHIEPGDVEPGTRPGAGGKFIFVRPLTDRTLYIQGRGIGTTNVMVYDESMKLIEAIDVDVVYDTSSVQAKIRASTANSDIRVSSLNGQIVLSGMAADSVAADRAVQVARSVLPAEGASLVNAITVAPSQQVMLQVRFLEASRSAAAQLGVNWFGANASGTRGFNTGLGSVSIPSGPTSTTSTSATSATSGTTTSTSTTASPVSVFQTVGSFVGPGSVSAPFGTVLANLVNKGAGSLDVMVTALEQKGVVRRLAEPDLIALSGDTASFLAGGEYPVPVVSGASGLVTPTVEYKPYGVQLTFMPTVLANGVINLRLIDTVSDLDYANAVTISGTTVPALTKREAKTTVELRDGQSFAVAGLLNSSNINNIAQIPWIGTVPVLGALFRSTAYQKNETDLIVIVTPHLVAPVAPGQRLATPLDDRLPANDVDLFLMGSLERRKQYSEYVTGGGGLQGPYGHMIRIEEGSKQPVSER